MPANLAITAAHAAWIPLSAGLFRVIGPTRASAFAVVGGLLLLPRGTALLGPFPFDKRTAVGLGLALGILLFDRASIARFRPRWVDLPMLAVCLVPLTGLISGPSGVGADVVDQICARLGSLLVPYAAGRIYFGVRDGPRRLAAAIVIGGLCYIPVCAYEEFAGPGRYLAGLIYGTAANEPMVRRLGGFRPEGFFEEGIELANFMAQAAVLSASLWAGRSWQFGRKLAWVPSLALLLTSLSCRGVYGYITLAVGMGVLGATRLFRTRLFLLLLLAVPLGYMASRVSGAWDGRLLDGLAREAGREGTVAARLAAETDAIGRVMARDPAFGFGVYLWHLDGIGIVDGLWVQLLLSGGLVGLVLYFTAVFLTPAALSLARPRSRPTAAEATSPTWGLAAFVLLGMFDTLHNSTVASTTALVAGCLVGGFLGRPAAARPGTIANAATNSDRPAISGILAATVVILIVLEVVGRLPRPDLTAESSTVPAARADSHRP